jgi:hypothetical protein
LGQGGAEAAYVFFTEAASILGSLGHEITDPQAQAINEYMGAWRDAMQVFRQTKEFFMGLPASALPLPAVPVDPLLHFWISNRAGGEKKSGASPGLNHLLGKSGFSRSAPPGNQNERTHG